MSQALLTEVEAASFSYNNGGEEAGDLLCPGVLFIGLGPIWPISLAIDKVHRVHVFFARDVDRSSRNPLIVTEAEEVDAPIEPVLDGSDLVVTGYWMK